MDFLEEEAEAGHDKSKAHHRESGANPGEEGSLGGEVVAQARFLGGASLFFHRAAGLFGHDPVWKTIVVS